MSEAFCQLTQVSMCAPLVTRKMSKRCFHQDYRLLGHHATLSDLLRMFRRSCMPLSSSSLLRSPCRWTQQLLVKVSSEKSSYRTRLWSTAATATAATTTTTASKNILLHLFPGSFMYMWRHAHNGVNNSIKTWKKTPCILQIPSRSLGIWFILRVVTTLSTLN